MTAAPDSTVPVYGPETHVVGKSYLLHEKLGEGGMGVVYRATHRLSGRQVALKLVHAAAADAANSGAARTRSDVPRSTQSGLSGLLPDGRARALDTSTLRNGPAQSATDLGAGARPRPLGGSSSSHSGLLSEGSAIRISLAKEFQTLAGLHHPHIVTVLDYGFDEHKQPFFTMELLESPKNILEAGAGQTVQGKAALLVQLLQAVAYSHRRRILHRDIKPSNVLVVDNRVKLLDFGIADVIGGGTGLAGTLEYMAPELFLGRPASVASDLYALGIVAFQLFTNRLPHSARESTAFLGEVLGKNSDATLALDAAELVVAAGLGSTQERGSEAPDREPPALLASDLDVAARPLCGIIDRLIAKSPDERYHDALEAIRDLNAALGQDLSTETEEIRESFLQAAEFVGRDTELKSLLQALGEAEKARGSLILVCGESGVGKTRLLAELRTRAVVRSICVVKSQGAKERSGNYHLWRSVLRELALATELDRGEIGILQDVVPDLGTLLGQLAESPPRLAPQAAQARLHACIETLLQRQKKPVLVVLEDLQWAAAESLELLAHVSQIITALPVMVVGTYREDEGTAMLQALPRSKLLRLGRLGRSQVAQLASSMLGAIGNRAPVVDYLHRQTEGNVFFLVEVVRSLAERAGQLNLVREEALPEYLLTGGIERLVDRRLEQVKAEDQELLKLAAVSGRRLDLMLLRSTSAERDLNDWLSRCANAAVLEATQGDWQFVHDKIRECLLKRMKDGEQAQLHRRVAEAIIQVHGEVTTQKAALAYHYAKGENPERAYQCYIVAGQEAARLFAVLEARAHYACALAALAALPPTWENRRRKVDTLFLLMEISLWAERSEQIVSEMTEAEALLLSLQAEGNDSRADKARLANAYFWMGRGVSMCCEYDRSIFYFKKAVQVASDCGAERLSAVSSGMIGRSLLLQGHFGACEHYLAPALAWLGPQGQSVDLGRVNASQGMAMVAHGQIEQGLTLLHQTLSHAKDPTHIATSHMYFTMAYLFVQDWESMQKSANQCIATAMQTKDELQVCAALWMAGWAESWLGLAEESAEHRTQARAIYTRRRNVPMYDWFAVADADGALNCGLIDESITLAQRAIEVARSLGGIYGQGLAHRVWARAIAAQPRPDWAAAESHLAESMRLLELGEAWIALAYTHLLAGDIAAARGDSQAAALYYERARARFAASLLRAAAQQAENRLGELSSPPHPLSIARA